jgi:hypothetical protein
MSRMIQRIRTAWCAFASRHDSGTVDGQPIVDWLRAQERSSRQQTIGLREQRTRSPIEQTILGQRPPRRHDE